LCGRGWRGRKQDLRGAGPGRATIAGPALDLEGEEKRERTSSHRAWAIHELVADYFVVFTSTSSNTPLQLIHLLLKLTLIKKSTTEFLVQNLNSAILNAITRR
jgi:hypothetical protein